MSWWKMYVPKNQGGMGFRDIHRFNLALLAKQAWHLLDNPDSLCASILREKYYPDGDLLNAKIRKGSSFTNIFRNFKDRHCIGGYVLDHNLE